ncbi:protein kinase [Candidatus Zixiibacteriota bacterium]
MPTKSPAIPLRFGEFIPEEKIGQGGICEVYRARQPALDRQVAVKVLRSNFLTNADLRRRFVSEAKILARLSHPNIIHVIDAGTEGEWAYYVMEYVEGIDYKQILREKEKTLNEKLDIIIQTLKGLEYAHNNGVIHRDLKPANIMVDRAGHARLADFGIAHLFARPGAEQETQTGDLMGTPAYMAPEQRTSAKNVDVRSDIFSMGVILYETITGKKPLGRVRPPSELNPEAPRSLDEIVLTCLEQDPDDRHQTAVALKDLLLELKPRRSVGVGRNEPVFTGVEDFIGRCKFLDTLNEGPTSQAYLVENTGDHRLYVIKKITGRGLELGRLRRLAVLKHRHILNVHGAGSDLEKTVIVTDYARGGSLADRLARRWSEPEVTQFLYEAAQALDFAHKNDIVHGNIRPSNVLFDDQGQVLLADFGLPPIVGKRKPWWRAPEKWPSREGDLFALGAIAYRMLFGDRPRWFSEENLYFPKVRNFVPRETRRMLIRLLHQDPEKRCSTAEEILMQYAPRARDGTAVPKVQRAARKVSIPVWLWILISAAAVIVGTILALWRTP